MTRDGTHYYGDDCPGGHQTFIHLAGTTATGYTVTADATDPPPALYDVQDIARAARQVLTPELLQRLLDGLRSLDTGVPE